LPMKPADQALCLAVLRGVVEDRDPGQFLGSTIGLCAYMEALCERGWMQGDPARPWEWRPTRSGLRIYVTTGLDGFPKGRWYFYTRFYERAVEGIGSGRSSMENRP
ncbi:hypothetical protein, partial [Thioalkalivibrio sp. ALgr3]|uniref:hypothetical protein n=1 Tax=Thioalkalivibrio sp. ALgr3 TaxID=1239292 RepID=UPI000571AEBF